MAVSRGYAAGTPGLTVNTATPGQAAINRVSRQGALGYVASIPQSAWIAAFAAQSGGAGGSGVSRWATVVTQALVLLGQSVNWVSTVLRRMNQESGGNPSIVNKWDSNWAAGHPSVGLMQVIAGTYAAYAGRFRNTGPFEYGVSVNPLANTYAGLNYAVHRYGSLAALNRPGGYKHGGLITEPMLGLGLATGKWSTFGEAGIETVTPGIGGGGDVGELIAAVDETTGAVEKLPGKIAAAMARALGGAAGAAAASAAYGAR
jgi:SLT domain-containing protein